MHDRPSFIRLPHQQRGGGGELVGGADLADPQGRPLRSGRPRRSSRPGSPASADGGADRAKPPGAAETVIDDDAEGDAGCGV